MGFYPILQHKPGTVARKMKVVETYKRPDKAAAGEIGLAFRRDN
jgi:hypothetical protein